MKITISGKNIDVTDALRNAVEGKLSKLEKYFAPDTPCNVTLGVEKGRQKMEVTIPMKGHIIRAEQQSDDMYVTLDLVVDVIEAQLKRHRKKLIDKQQNTASLRKEFIEEEPEGEEEEEIDIVRVKKIGVKPMFPEDACLQMELLGHNFFVFTNAENGAVNVVYKRKDRRYGLIEPEM